MINRTELDREAREGARERGHLRYMSSRACGKGHHERFVSSGNCCGCQRDYQLRNRQVPVVAPRVVMRPPPQVARRSDSAFEVPLARLMAGR